MPPNRREGWEWAVCVTSTGDGQEGPARPRGVGRWWGKVQCASASSPRLQLLPSETIGRNRQYRQAALHSLKGDVQGWILHLSSVVPHSCPRDRALVPVSGRSSGCCWRAGGVWCPHRQSSRWLSPLGHPQPSSGGDRGCC